MSSIILLLFFVGSITASFKPEREFEVKQGGLLNNGRSYTFVIFFFGVNDDHSNLSESSRREKLPSKKIPIDLPFKTNFSVSVKSSSFWKMVYPRMKSSIRSVISIKSKSIWSPLSFEILAFQMEYLRCENR